MELTDTDLHLFNEGTHRRIYEKLGAQVEDDGTRFAVWAPDAEYVSVIGDFNHWDPGASPLTPRASSGIWEGPIAGVAGGALYKYHIAARQRDYRVNKADPVGFSHETPPKTASIVTTLDYAWGDARWMASRGANQSVHAPVSIYELHLGSWRRQNDRWLSYRDIAKPLADYVVDLGFTHVELMPVMEHPFYGSWGYQVTGYFAPTSRYGAPQDLMFLIDTLHQRGIGVILDWVPAHFPTDEHGLGFFDGTHLYEHKDPRRGFHPDWQSFIFNYSRTEVRSFLVSSAMFWLDRYHADALRVDGVASMLYLDYSRPEDGWLPNPQGGRENLEAMTLLQATNAAAYADFPGIQTVAEESTAWPGVSRPADAGGLGFGFKWDMGWMHDTLKYLRRDPVHRKYHHNELTFRMVYAFTENFMLALSHDEVVHGKGSLLAKMPGDDWQRHANLRLLFAYQWSQPGKKLLFMGGEFGQWHEWNHDKALDWDILRNARHVGVQRLVKELNRLYREEPALGTLDCDPAGFSWIDHANADHSVLVYLRHAPSGRVPILVAINFTPTPRHHYRVGVDTPGFWDEILNTDATYYGGSGLGNLGRVESAPVGAHGRAHSLSLTLPPLAAVFLRAPQ